ncbi:efflux transporter outer membrane subunit [Cupriavidus oxalaticus]|uniref:Efflux transporter outer membrane subunit n=1 Tax=Cupriavidus oxalaticus TaxID=96344 RepID=A0A375G4M2_9BURK|nr:efflux transporter outer membrane subunit [Cupriavidus oxalaticus]QRQ88584.1 efflux transporter outer membrane subunit [Cupriavidus oxalaticus]QRQ93090.1 efflux transporter outer membrane subunit [Cupriavidus oxalaticus]SPC13048.1 Outer membrane protein OprM [Cupriavidus oxalaticus]
MDTPVRLAPTSAHPRRRHPASPSLLALAAVALAGCVSMAPPLERPAAPVPATFAQAGRIDTQATASAATGWRDYFTDPALQALIGQALDNSRDLRAAVLRVEEAQALYGIRRADRFPTIGLDAAATRSRTPRDFSLTGQPMTANDFQVGLGMTAWELDFWGRVRSLEDAALQNFLATDAARQATATSLAGQVANSYLVLRELDERIALTNETIATRAESLRIFRRRYELGSTSKFDLTQVEAQWRQARTLGAQLEQERTAQANALALLVGAPVELPPAAHRFDDDHVLRDVRPGLPSDLLANRPDIVAAEHQLAAANANIGAARAAFFPRIALTGSIGTASLELDSLFTGPNRAWSFGPTLSLPIFDGGRNRSNLQLAEVRRDQAVVQYEKAIQSAFRDVSDALNARAQLARQVTDLQATLDLQAERARLAKLRYDNGATPYLEVLDAQRDLLAAQQLLVQTRRALLSSRVALYTALGGGAADFAGPAAADASVSTSSDRPAS